MRFVGTINQHLEVEGLVAVEHQDKASQLVAQSLHRLSLSCSSRTWEGGSGDLLSVNKLIQLIINESSLFARKK